jgi:two-component system OmpR family sensor kinase
VTGRFRRPLPVRVPVRGPVTLRGQLTAGLVGLLALACLAVGVATAFAISGFLVGRLDQQLGADSDRFAVSLEHGGHPERGGDLDTRGQADGTLGARLLGGRVTQAAVVRGRADRTVPLTAADRRALAAVPADGHGRSLRLSALGRYRVSALPGRDGDVLITGLPLHPVEETVHRLETVEAVVFGAALLVTGVLGAFWVRLSLRPLRRVTATAADAARLPLASGEVAMPAPVEVTDPRGEVGQVATALNRLLGHVGDALARRQAVEERLRHFAADASHELRTPVATVRAHAELALRHRGPMAPPVHRALERIAAESGRMSRLVEDLLLLARLDAGRSLEREAVDLTRLVLEAVEDARAAAPDHRWRLDLPADAVTVTGDEHRLQQVVANLTANARVHTPPGTEVTVRLRTAPGAVHLTVADNGPGIPDEVRSDVFGRFVRADASRSRTAGGTGLGLAIVHAVVTAHHGTITLDSGPGGSTFHVTLAAAGEG